MSSVPTDNADSENGMEFLQPRGLVAGRFSEATSELLYAGEVGCARLPGTSISLAEFIVRKIETWVEALLKKAEPA